MQHLELLAQHPAYDRLLGAFYGHALGDALGFPLEFAPDPDFDGLLTQRPRLRSRYQGTRHGVVGQVSDDTMMTMALLYSVVENRGWQRQQVIGSYLEFAAQTSFLGRNTRALFKGVNTIAGYEKRWQKEFQEKLTTQQLDSITQSNGCIMRALPLAFLNPDLAVQDCVLSNPHPLNVQCVLSYTNLVRTLLCGLNSEQAIMNAQAPILNPTLQGILLQASRGQLPDIQTNRGWVVYPWILSFAAAQAPNYHDWTVQILRLYPKCDTDTILAVTGGVIGARLGLSGLLAEPPTRRNLQLLLEAKPVEGDFPCREKFHPRQYLTLLPELVRILQEIAQKTQPGTEERA